MRQHYAIFELIEGRPLVFTYLKVFLNATYYRCTRAQAEWHQEKHLAKVIKVIKGLVHSYGFQDKTGIYLYPEEMLYLVESVSI